MTSLPFRPDAPWLAPLAGWSDLPFRLLCRELGAAVCCTEMISAKGLAYGGRNTEELLATTPDDAPLVAQIFGSEPPFMARAVDILKERGFTWFDVNMGCSVPKVNKTGSGSALLKDIPQALAVADAVIRVVGPGRAGFKIRLGWEDRPDRGGDVYRELAVALAERGAGWITLHPRYARQGFSGEARHEALAELAALLPVPVIASGDLFRAEDGVAVLAATGAATVMYARGALSNPAIFARHKALLAGETTDAMAAANAGDMGPDGSLSPAALARMARMIRRHAELARLHAPRTALLKMRTSVPRYVKHMDGARALRQKLITCTDWDTLDRILTESFGPADSAPGTSPAPAFSDRTLS